MIERSFPAENLSTNNGVHCDRCRLGWANVIIYIPVFDVPYLGF